MYVCVPEGLSVCVSVCLCVRACVNSFIFLTMSKPLLILSYKLLYFLWKVFRHVA